MSLPARIKDGPHIRLSQDYFEEAEEAGLDPMAAYLYLRMATRVRQLHSDGWIHEVHVARLGVTAWRKRADALCHIGWLREFRDDRNQRRWYVPAYPKWNLLEDDYSRAKHNGRLGGCTAKHDQPCDRPNCNESRSWLDAHPETPLRPPVQGGLKPPLEHPV